MSVNSFSIVSQLAFEAFHNNKKFVRGHMGKLYIGDIVDEEKEVCIQNAISTNIITNHKVQHDMC